MLCEIDFSWTLILTSLIAENILCSKMYSMKIDLIDQNAPKVMFFFISKNGHQSFCYNFPFWEES